MDHCQCDDTLDRAPRTNALAIGTAFFIFDCRFECIRNQCWDDDGICNPFR